MSKKRVIQPGIAVFDGDYRRYMRVSPVIVVPPGTGTLLSSVTKDGVTFNFTKPILAGQYITGDWWVVPAAGDTGVVVASKTPAMDTTAGSERNGHQVSPMTSGSNGYDARITNFSAALAPAFPYNLLPDHTLVSAISLGTTVAGGTANATQLSMVVPLTCVSTPPAADAFRPSYYPAPGLGKRTFRQSQLVLSHLPGVPDPVGVPSAPSIASVAARFAKVQLDQSGIGNGNCHPQPLNSFFAVGESPPVTPHGYGQLIAQDNGTALLRLALNDGSSALMPLLLNVVQACIDWYGAVKQGWSIGPDGGHSNGRKIMVAFGGYMLGDADMQTVGGSNAFGEVGHFTWQAGAGGATPHFDTMGVGMSLFGRNALGFPYAGANAKDAWDPSHYLDGSDPVNLSSSPPYSGTGYIQIASGHPITLGTILSLYPGLRAIFNGDAILHYGNRYADFGWWTQPDGASATRPATVGSINPYDWAAVYARHGTNRTSATGTTTWQNKMRTAYNVSTFLG